MTMCIMLTSANFFGSQKAQEIKFSSRIQAETEQIQLVFTQNQLNNSMQLRFKRLTFHGTMSDAQNSLDNYTKSKRETIEL